MGVVARAVARVVAKAVARVRGVMVAVAVVVAVAAMAHNIHFAQCLLHCMGVGGGG
jgi:hypothetical protein